VHEAHSTGIGLPGNPSLFNDSPDTIRRFPWLERQDAEQGRQAGPSTRPHAIGHWQDTTSGSEWNSRVDIDPFPTPATILAGLASSSDGVHSQDQPTGHMVRTPVSIRPGPVEETQDSDLLYRYVHSLTIGTATDNNPSDAEGQTRFLGPSR
jgi:hypothetical protein